MHWMLPQLLKASRKLLSIFEDQSVHRFLCANYSKLFKIRNGNGMLPFSLLLRCICQYQPSIMSPSQPRTNRGQERDLISFQLSIHHSLAAGICWEMRIWSIPGELYCKFWLRPLVTWLPECGLQWIKFQLFAPFPSSGCRENPTEANRHMQTIWLWHSHFAMVFPWPIVK